MKAFTAIKYSEKEKLILAELPMPVAKDNEVLIQVHAAGVNLLDSMIKKGAFKFFLPYKPPFVLGHDVAGVITQVGSGVKNFKVGDEVYARPSDFHIGTFAEYISIPESDVALIPNNVSMEEAASVPLVGLTAWQALIEIGKLKKGQKVFIQAGSGGVGTFAIQLAKYMGTTVATTTSTGNIDMVKKLGADVIIDYRKEDFESRLKDYDIVLHSNRDSKILEKSLRILKQGGTLISLTGPPTPEFASEIHLAWHVKSLTKLLSWGVKKKAKKLQVNFSFLFMKADGSQLSEITALINAGLIKPVVDKIYPFEQTNEAMAYVETGRAKGKVVVKAR